MNKNAKKDTKNTGKSGNHTIRLHIKGAMANAAPPIGPALSQWKVNIMGFCKAFNDQTQDKKGVFVPVDIFVKPGGAYTFRVGEERSSDAIRRVLDIPKGSSNPGRENFKTITREQLRSIVQQKHKDLTAFDEEGAINTLAGTARSMGIKLID